MTTDLYETPRSISSVADCEFYHTMEVPDIGLVEGQWDLREGVDDYLGGVDFTDTRVLEIGPASGFLTFHMERTAREVVALDLPMDDASFWDLVPYHHMGLSDRNKRESSEVEQNFFGHIGRIRNGFWLAYEKFQSRSKVYYGSPSDLPDELGTFDIALLGSVLLHTQSPLRTLESCARLTTGTIIITEQWHPNLGQEPVCRLAPTVENEVWDTWWTFTPQFFLHYLAVLGFGKQSCTTHKHLAHGEPFELFTVVASRGG